VIAPRNHRRRLEVGFAVTMVAALALLMATCARPEPRTTPSAEGSMEPTERSTKGSATSDVKASADWDVIYRVLTHPRCMNCHPAGDAPLQGDDSHPHAQNVQRGTDGRGLFAMRCETCHQNANLPGPHLPPGAPTWHLPESKMPLVFEGRSSEDLCRQIKDPERNGGKTIDQILHHMADDQLVGWGWDPGEGRTPVPIPRAQLVAALRSWIAGGCQCP
jgi:hypothetical protein